MSLRVSKLWIHPVKSCRAVGVDAIELDELGVVGDRRFLITDLSGRMLTQRSHPMMARIAARLGEQELTLACDGAGAINVPRQAHGARLVQTAVWGSEGLVAEDCGEHARGWLTGILGTPAQLLRIGPGYHRPVKHHPDDEVDFADGYPLLAISEASLDQLNDRLVQRGAEPVPMDRFRPNLVIQGAAPHAEDGWTRIRIGDVVLRGATLCSRCIVTTTDQQTGTRDGPEPLRTLATYRRDPVQPQDVNFGRNLINESKRGTIRVGDSIEPMP